MNNDQKVRNQFFEELAHSVEDKEIYVVPNDHKLLSLETFKDKVRGRFSADSLESLRDYADQYKSNPVVFVSGGSVRVALDYHRDESTPGKCLHSAEYSSKANPAFLAIKEIQQNPLSQRAFVNFFTDYRDEIIEPDAATVLEQLRAARKVQRKAK